MSTNMMKKMSLMLIAMFCMAGQVAVGMESPKAIRSPIAAAREAANKQMQAHNDRLCEEKKLEKIVADLVEAAVADLPDETKGSARRAIRAGIKSKELVVHSYKDVHNRPYYELVRAKPQQEE